MWCEGGGRIAENKYATIQNVLRCPVCNARFTLRAKFCVGGEFNWWVFPPHKVKVRKSKIYKKGQRKKKSMDL